MRNTFLHVSNGSHRSCLEGDELNYPHPFFQFSQFGLIESVVKNQIFFNYCFFHGVIEVIF